MADETIWVASYWITPEGIRGTGPTPRTVEGPLPEGLHYGKGRGQGLSQVWSTEKRLVEAWCEGMRCAREDAVREVVQSSQHELRHTNQRIAVLEAKLHNPITFTAKLDCPGCHSTWRLGGTVRNNIITFSSLDRLGVD